MGEHHPGTWDRSVKGPWAFKERLGSGTFGEVILWKNRTTGVIIALKHYKGPMEPKNCHRWTQEVKIMNQLNHSQIIKAFPVPEELKVTGEPEILAMEYCEGGDLRRVFGKPENSCGLPQAEVNDIASQICSGVEYLHHHQIIHRDLKPENIVLKPKGDGKNIYKIIDLGYAKDTRYGSIAQSFAGTLQYAAPELMEQKQYTKTVDYWSLGCVVFELITGVRPFHPLDSVNTGIINWYNRIKQKSDLNICITEDLEGERQSFSDILPLPHLLTSLSAKLYEKWIQMMLRMTANIRGGDDSSGRTKCFVMVDQIVSLQEYKVLDMTKNKLLVYCNQEVKLVCDLQRKLAEPGEANIAQDQQDILSFKGAFCGPMTELKTRPDNKHLPDYFLFRKVSSSDDPDTIDDINFHLPELPPMAKVLLEQPNRKMLKGRIRLRQFAQCLHACNTMVQDAVQILESLRTAKMCLLKVFSDLNNVKQSLNNAYYKLQGKKKKVPTATLR